MKALLEVFKLYLPKIIDAVLQSVLANVGGFRLWLVKKILDYGGRALIDSISEAIRQHDREVAQQKAKEELEKVKNDPATTPEKLGEEYSDYFNSGRKP